MITYDVESYEDCAYIGGNYFDRFDYKDKSYAIDLASLSDDEPKIYSLSSGRHGHFWDWPVFATKITDKKKIKDITEKVHEGLDNFFRS